VRGRSIGCWHSAQLAPSALQDPTLPATLVALATASHRLNGGRQQSFRLRCRLGPMRSHHGRRVMMPALGHPLSPDFSSARNAAHSRCPHHRSSCLFAAFNRFSSLFCSSDSWRWSFRGCDRPVNSETLEPFSDVEAPLRPCLLLTLCWWATRPFSIVVRSGNRVISDSRPGVRPAIRRKKKKKNFLMHMNRLPSSPKYGAGCAVC